MGFFDSLAKIAKDVANDVVKGLDGTENSSNNSNNNNQPAEVNTANTNNTANAQSSQTSPTETFRLETIEFTPVSTPGSIQYESKTSIVDDRDNRHNIKQIFNISKDFRKIRSMAGEIESLFIYEPQTTDDLDNHADTPYLFIGTDNNDFTLIIQKYLNTKTIPKDTTLFRVNNSIAIYKTTSYFPKSKSVCYYFKREYEHSYLYQLGAGYGRELEGTETEQIVLTALDELVSTYQEIVVN